VLLESERPLGRGEAASWKTLITATLFGRPHFTATDRRRVEIDQPCPAFGFGGDRPQ
jgi:hypothetical protein